MRPSEGTCDNHPVEEGPGLGSQSGAAADLPTNRRLGSDGAYSDAISEGARVHGDIGSPTDVPPSTLDPRIMEPPTVVDTRRADDTPISQPYAADAPTSQDDAPLGVEEPSREAMASPQRGKWLEAEDVENIALSNKQVLI